MKHLYSHALDAHAFIYNLLQIKKKIVLTYSQMETTLHVYSIHSRCRVYLPSSICQDIAPKVLFIKVKQYFIPQGMIYR